MAWGMYIQSSNNIIIFGIHSNFVRSCTLLITTRTGAGFYSFFQVSGLRHPFFSLLIRVDYSEL
jgi:hypothetical protein